MSNVLIGIIGVVLFIGLALAGALILGSDFLSATSDSKAATIVQQLQQGSSAAAMYNLKTGTQIVSNATAASPLMGRFLKTDLINPTALGGPAFMIDSTGQSSGAGPALFVMMFLRGDGQIDQQICESIQRNTGQIAQSAPFDATPHVLTDVPGMPFQAGCFQNQTMTRYTAYSKI